MSSKTARKTTIRFKRESERLVTIARKQDRANIARFGNRK